MEGLIMDGSSDTLCGDCEGVKCVDQNMTGAVGLPSSSSVSELRTSDIMAKDKITVNKLHCSKHVEFNELTSALPTESDERISDLKRLPLPSLDQILEGEGTYCTPVWQQTPSEPSYMEEVSEFMQLFSARLRISVFVDSLVKQPNNDKDMDELLQCIQNIISSGSLSDLRGSVSSLLFLLEDNARASDLFVSELVSFLCLNLICKRSLLDCVPLLGIFTLCIHHSMNTPLLPETIEYIKKEKLLSKIFSVLQNLVEEGSSFSGKKVKEILGFCSSNEAKYSAKVSCLPPYESRNSLKGMCKGVRDESELYLIHVWQIKDIHEIIDGSSSSIINSIASRDTNIYIQGDQRLHPEISDELIDLRIKHVHKNGIVFTVNQENWNDMVKEISTSIEKMTVKKMLDHQPTPGSTYAVHIHPSLAQSWKLSPEVAFVRLRVVKVDGDLVHVFAIDVGQVMTCLWMTLQLLPARLLCIPPCGRLARLPITCLAGNRQVKAVYALLLTLVHHLDIVEDIDLNIIHHWIEDTSLVHHTLHLLLALSRKFSDHSSLKKISSIVVGYLHEEAFRKNMDIIGVQLAVQVIKEVIEIWDGVRITITKAGGFIALCELAYQEDMEEVWQTIGTVLWGRRRSASWQKNRYPCTMEVGNEEWKGCSCKAKSICASIKQGQCYSGQHNVAMEKRQQLASLPKQLVHFNSHYSCHSQHHWRHSEEWLRYGCIITVPKDLTHYIVHEKSVSNLRMDTLLQITLGILNVSHGGRIYIGLTPSRVVEGIRMSRSQRDCFKLGLSKLLTEQVKPSVQPCDFFIKYTSVKKEMELDAMAKELFLITITLQRGIGIVHYADPALIYKYEGGVPLLQRGSALYHSLKEKEKWEAEQEADVAQERAIFLQIHKKE